MHQQINFTIVLFHCVTDSQCFVNHFTINPLKTKPGSATSIPLKMSWKTDCLRGESSPRGCTGKLSNREVWVIYPGPAVKRIVWFLSHTVWSTIWPNKRLNAFSRWTSGWHLNWCTDKWGCKNGVVLFIGLLMHGRPAISNRGYWNDDLSTGERGCNSLASGIVKYELENAA